MAVRLGTDFATTLHRQMEVLIVLETAQPVKIATVEIVLLVNIALKIVGKYNSFLILHRPSFF